MFLLQNQKIDEKGEIVSMCKAVLRVSGFLDAGGFQMFRKEYGAQASGSVFTPQVKVGRHMLRWILQKELFNHRACPLFEIFCSFLNMGWCK